MKKKWFNKQFVLSFFFFLVFIGAVVVNEMDLLKKFTTVPVVMAKEAIDKDTLITEEMVYVYQMPRELVNDSMFKSTDDVVGKTATHLIMPSQYVSPNSLDHSILKPTAEHEFFPIPDNWLINIQGTLRRYDLVNISAVLASTNNNEEVTTHSIQSKVKSEFILEDVPVAYVKDSRNSEVTGTTSGDDRLYGTTRPSSIQLSLTLEDFKTLEKLVLEGYRLILSY